MWDPQFPTGLGAIYKNYIGWGLIKMGTYEIYYLIDCLLSQTTYRLTHQQDLESQPPSFSSSFSLKDQMERTVIYEEKVCNENIRDLFNVSDKKTM